MQRHSNYGACFYVILIAFCSCSSNTHVSHDIKETDYECESLEERTRIVKGDDVFRLLLACGHLGGVKYESSTIVGSGLVPLAVLFPNNILIEVLAIAPESNYMKIESVHIYASSELKAHRLEASECVIDRKGFVYIRSSQECVFVGMKKEEIEKNLRKWGFDLKNEVESTQNWVYKSYANQISFDFQLKFYNGRVEKITGPCQTSFCILFPSMLRR